jgi:hypothetical protein
MTPVANAGQIRLEQRSPSNSKATRSNVPVESTWSKNLENL